jgi:hypothetical protein
VREIVPAEAQSARERAEGDGDGEDHAGQVQIASKLRWSPSLNEFKRREEPEPIGDGGRRDAVGCEEARLEREVAHFRKRGWRLAKAQNGHRREDPSQRERAEKCRG